MIPGYLRIFCVIWSPQMLNLAVHFSCDATKRRVLLVNTFVVPITVTTRNIIIEITIIGQIVNI